LRCSVDAPLGAQGAVVTRRSIRGMSANDPDLAAMRRAVAAMKRLPQSAARNWTRFADIHRNFHLRPRGDEDVARGEQFHGNG